MYPAFLETKLWLKWNTPFGRMANLHELEIDEDLQPASQSHHPAQN
jgi:hypothetical protein